ncbi:MAG: hypothetical protein F4080_11235 [Holophagales bacterium]|nr:hypothetical protein [Holophagales bacterium]
MEEAQSGVLQEDRAFASVQTGVACRTRNRTEGSMMRNQIAWTMLGATLMTGAGLVTAAPPPAQHRVLVQEGAPLSIGRYSAAYQSRGQYSREGIRHEVVVENVTDRKIVAYQLGLLSFNIFNEFQDRLGGYAIKDVVPGGTEEGAWLASALAESSFYTGVAYVSKVRFDDGEVWQADLEEVADQVREIEESFSVESLTGGRD